MRLPRGLFSDASRRIDLALDWDIGHTRSSVRWRTLPTKMTVMVETLLDGDQIFRSMLKTIGTARQTITANCLWRTAKLASPVAL